MVFPSVPLYLDPANWSQQHQGGANHEPQNPNLPPAPPAQAGGATAVGGPIRASPMAERARMAKIPMTEGPLKCPRCDSINTKFCYFNNYSLSQPRHFCKTCRRYWTRGGALRSVPVGGGCRRSNKRRKTTSSRPKTQEPVGTAPHPAGGLGSAPSRLHDAAQAPLPFPFMANSHLMGSMGFGDHVPFLGGFGLGLGSSPSSVFPFSNEGVETAPYGKSTAVKPQLNLSSQVVDEGQFWSSNGGLWMDISGLSSSSAAADHNHRHDHRNL